MKITGCLSIPNLVIRLKKQVPANKIVELKFGNCRIRVTTNQDKIIHRLQDYFRPFLSPVEETSLEISLHECPPLEFEQSFRQVKPDRGKIKIKEETIELTDGRIVRKCLTQMVFLFGRESHMAIGPCLENLNQVVNYINNCYIEWELHQGHLLGHAAAVVWQGKGLAIAGISGAGKSTLSLRLMNLGAHLVSNDRLLIKPQNKQLGMRGVAKLPRINPGTILHNPRLSILLTQAEQKSFTGLLPKELWALEQKYDVPLDLCFGPNRFVLEAPLEVLVVLNWQLGNGVMRISEVNLEERADLLNAFIKPVGQFFLPRKSSQMPYPSQKNYLRWLSQCRVIELSGGAAFEQAAHSCLKLLQAGSF